MKKLFALLLAMAMVFSMVACSKQDDSQKDPGNENQGDQQQQQEQKTITNPDEINDTMTSSDGKYEVAFVTDVGQLKDKSFNQGTFDGVKLYAGVCGG